MIVLPLLLVGLPLYFFCKKRIDWLGADYLLLVLPAWVWILFGMIDTGKTKENFQEAVILSWFLPMLLIIRIIAGRRIHQKRMSITFLVLASAAAFGLWAFVPPL